MYSIVCQHCLLSIAEGKILKTGNGFGEIGPKLDFPGGCRNRIIGFPSSQVFTKNHICIK